MLSRTLLVSTVTVLAVFCGLVPDFTRHSISVVFSSIAYAQAINDEVIADYAKAVLAMEPIRQQASNKLKQILGADNVPRFFDCSPDKVNGLSKAARDVMDDYCSKSQSIVTSNNLSFKQFNDITTAISGNPPADPVLKQRVQQEVVHLQSQSQ
ncbi:MAG: DUF4168 domain-containing protein [Chroococcidiopsidaceae cyanobacterium CP_BM_ER_R8_30]|nr:DUF4168 domain-containing protein [Chroococcidiopsidaceae cyanobacterium CP_BM_ER_R8_30]